MLSTFCTFCITSHTKTKTESFNWPPIHFLEKFTKSPNMNNLFVCIIISENNNKQNLNYYFYQHIAFFGYFFIKELVHYIVVHTFFDQTGKTVGESMEWTNTLTFTYIKNVIRLVLITLFYCDHQKFYLTCRFFQLFVHGDQKRNNIYSQRWTYEE